MENCPERIRQVSDSDLSLASGADLQLDHHAAMGLRIQSVGNEQVAQRWHAMTFCQPYWRAYITDRAGVVLEQDRERLPYAPDAITIIPAWCTFTFLADTAVRHGFIHSSLRDWPSPLVRRWFPRALSLRSPDLVQRLRRLVRSIDQPDRSSLCLSQAAGIMADCLDRLMDPWPAAKQAEFWRSARHPRLDPALTYIHQRLDAPIAVADLAGLLGVGEARCIRLFREGLGQTPTQYILEQRVALAADLLASPGEGLDAIARRCGFPNRRYLSRVFKERMGLPPGAYRQRFIG
jgi:AraC-like DNA-binding protein